MTVPVSCRVYLGGMSARSSAPVVLFALHRLESGTTTGDHWLPFGRRTYVLRKRMANVTRVNMTSRPSPVAICVWGSLTGHRSSRGNRRFDCSGSSSSVRGSFDS
jgi:hypothetical protein